MTRIPASLGVTHPVVMPRRMTTGASRAKNALRPERSSLVPENFCGGGEAAQPRRVSMAIVAISNSATSSAGRSPATNMRAIETCAVMA